MQIKVDPTEEIDEAALARVIREETSYEVSVKNHGHHVQITPWGQGETDGVVRTVIEGAVSKYLNRRKLPR